MTTTATPAAGAAGAVASAAAAVAGRKDPLDDITAGAAWLAIYAKHRQIRGTAVAIWKTTWEWYDDYAFERTHLWAHRLRVGAVVCGLFILGLYFKVVPENLRTAELTEVTWWCLGICVATYLVTWVPFVPSLQVRSATMADLRAHREPYELAQHERVEAEREDRMSPTAATATRVSTAVAEETRTRQEYNDFLEQAGPSNRPIILVSCLLLGTFIRYGFALKAAAEYFAARGATRPEYMDLMWAAGVDFFVVVFGIIAFMYAASAAGALLAEVETLFIKAKIGVEAVLTPGGETADSLERKRRLKALADGSDPDRLAIDVLLYRLWQSCVSMLVAAFGQFVVFWQNVNHVVSINSFTWSWAITAVELLIYWGVRDPTLRQKKVARWLRLLALTSLIPSVHYALMGRYVERQDGVVVRGPASAWLDHGPIAWAIALYHWVVGLVESFIAFLASPLSTTWRGITWYATLFYRMDGWELLFTIFKLAVFGGLIFGLLAPKLSEWLKKIDNAWVKKVVQVGGVAILVFLTLKIATVTAKSPVDAAERPHMVANVQRDIRRRAESLMGSQPSVPAPAVDPEVQVRNQRRAGVASCARNAAGHPPCTTRCYVFHGLQVPPGPNPMEHEQELGYCYDPDQP